MHDILRREFARARRNHGKLSCLLIDIDHFKKINEKYGHLQGDNLLQRFSHLVNKTSRRADFVWRRSGEEFLLILPETDRKGAECLANRLRRTTRTIPICKLDNAEPLKEIKLNISIGVAVYPDPRIHTEDDLVELADEALSRAKIKGKNRVMTA